MWAWLPEVGDLLLSRSKDTWLSESSVRPVVANQTTEKVEHRKRKQTERASDFTETIKEGQTYYNNAV